MIKIGKEGEKGAPPQAILDWEEKWFDVVRFEVSELRPNIVVFFSGHAYDGCISRIFPSVSFDGLNQRPTEHLARVTGSDLLPDGSTIRTYHPGYLFRQGRACFAEYMAEIVAAIQNVRTRGERQE